MPVKVQGKNAFKYSANYSRFYQPFDVSELTDMTINGTEFFELRIFCASYHHCRFPIVEFFLQMSSFEELQKEQYIQFQISEWPFRELLQKIFDCENLERLHTQLPNEGKDFPLLTFENDQSTVFHKRFYSSPFFDEFLEMYHRFIRAVIAPMFRDRRVVFQNRPTFRVCLPNNVAVGFKHRDFDFHHPASEINFWMPFTSVFDSNGLYVESQPELGDFHPITLGYGQMFRFYGNKCWHYNEVNRTGITRVSIDFRVIPGSLWDDSSMLAGETVKSKMRFVIGSYYAEHDRGDSSAAAAPTDASTVVVTGTAAADPR